MKTHELLESFISEVPSKTVLNLGTAGEIELTEADPDLGENAVITFTAEARISKITIASPAQNKKGKSRIRKLQVIAAIDASTFEIQGVTMPVDDPKLPLDGEDIGAEGPDGWDKAFGDPNVPHAFSPIADADPDEDPACAVCKLLASASIHDPSTFDPTSMPAEGEEEAK